MLATFAAIIAPLTLVQVPAVQVLADHEVERITRPLPVPRHWCDADLLAGAAAVATVEDPCRRSAR
jgi:hypothetical protein